MSLKVRNDGAFNTIVATDGIFTNLKTQNLVADSISNLASYLVATSGAVYASGVSPNTVSNYSAGPSQNLTGFDPVTGIFTVPEDGVYSLAASGVFIDNGSLGTFRMIAINTTSGIASTIAQNQGQPSPVGNSTFLSTTTGALPFLAGDSASVAVAQDSGADMSINVQYYITKVLSNTG